jgi:MYXO-CTERM domain-containing protein
MEGNTWIDNGDGTWSTDYQGTSTYSDLDLYLMGFIPPTDVGPQTFLQVSAEEQTRVGLEPASSPNYFNCTVDPNGCENTTVAATPVSFGVDSIVAAEGVRNPDDTSSQRTFKMAFIVLALQGDDTSDETLDRVDALRQTWETDWESDARGLADLDTTLGQSSAPEWGTEIPDTAGEDTGVDSALPDDSSPVADNETPKAEEPGGCGCAAGQPVGLLGGLLGVAALLRRRRSA